MKRIISVLLVAVIVLSALLSLSFCVSAESLYIRKIVSVVYDDSGSMSGNKAAYANYAMQAFCGMLNSEDQLFITYMSEAKKNSNYNPPQIDLSAGQIQNSVDTIRGRSIGGSTPYTAVEAAYNKLKSVNDSNSNTQYWLVVITDGAFDESSKKNKSEQENFLNNNFKKYTESVMPNGTNPQVTFLGIGNIASPKENTSKGIFTFSASDADGIINAMAKMSDRISGRTRLDKKEVKKVGENTIQVSSTIPLLNIAVFAQESDAKITKAVYSNEKEITISRKASLKYPGFSNLIGGAYLIGDSQNVIGAGTYNISFDKPIDLDDVVVLFEPALEMRMTVSLNGKKLSDLNELQNAAEKEKLSVSCKIYEMGTDNEISPSLLPPSTKFQITVTEDGKVANQVSGKEMTMNDYELKNVETVLQAAAIIEGFNPIACTIKFTPVDFYAKANITIEPSFGSNLKSIKYDKLSANKELTVCFTVLADGTPITDTEIVKSLKPTITVTPSGNSGTTTYTNDGKIVFTPNSTDISAYKNQGSFDVTVKCQLENGASATEKYTVLIAEYLVVPVNSSASIRKTKFFGNGVGASFYITKDGAKLSKREVENQFSVSLDEKHSDLLVTTTTAADGTITVIPYSEKERKLTFWNWWVNWAYYFGLPSDDVMVTLAHSYGTATAIIDVKGETVVYQIFNVYLPLLIELAALGFLITWIILIITKPRYLKSAKLYVGTIRYNRDDYNHTIRDFTVVHLSQYNKIAPGNGRLKFKRTADVISASGIRIRADHGGRIVCEMPFPWYKSEIYPVDTDFVELNTPAEVAEYVLRNRKLYISEFSTTITVQGDFNRSLSPSSQRLAKYIVVPDAHNGRIKVDDRDVINSGKIFIYING